MHAGAYAFDDPTPKHSLEYPFTLAEGSLHDCRSLLIVSKLKAFAIDKTWSGSIVAT